jgi:predicted membrane protein
MIALIAKIALAVLCLGCLLDMPYGYFMFVRWAALLVFAGLAWEAYHKNEARMALLWAGLAVLFQPLVKIALGRTMWNVVDVLVAVVLVATVVIELQKPQKKE